MDEIEDKLNSTHGGFLCITSKNSDEYCYKLQKNDRKELRLEYYLKNIIPLKKHQRWYTVLQLYKREVILCWKDLSYLYFSPLSHGRTWHDINIGIESMSEVRIPQGYNKKRKIEEGEKNAKLISWLKQWSKKRMQSWYRVKCNRSFVNMEAGEDGFPMNRVLESKQKMCKFIRENWCRVDDIDLDLHH